LGQLADQRAVVNRSSPAAAQNHFSEMAAKPSIYFMAPHEVAEWLVSDKLHSR